MNKMEMVKQISEKTNLSKKDVKRSLDTTLHIIREMLHKGEKLTLVGFGTFSTYKRKERIARNPRTGKNIKVKARKVAKFKAGKALSMIVHRSK
ncbi:MAG TPA: HU family DNA-binding protein [Candidatus Wallbacteria bacterium]|nr:HU family DNA-binding protein [Candidatus Wallbacteria bacterium]